MNWPGIQTGLWLINERLLIARLNQSQLQALWFVFSLLFNVLCYWKSKKGRLSRIDQTCVVTMALVKAVIIVPPWCPVVCVGLCLSNAHPDTRSLHSSCIMGCIRPLTCNLNKRPINRPAIDPVECWGHTARFKWRGLLALLAFGRLFYIFL